MVFPFGTVNLNGKWEEVGFNKVSKQKTFRNIDSTEILVCINDCKNYEFNSDRKATNDKFMERFYNWEKEYFEQNPNLKVSILEQDTTKKYLIYNIKGNIKEINVNTIILISESNCNVKTLSITKTGNIKNENAIKLIKQTYYNE